ncbi:MAG: phosphopantothenoylcysteine synthetase/decarboxylase [Cognaticolwellia sp.]
MNILLGVSGGIAAYKACDLVSLANKQGHQVQVVMTAGATRFVTPLSFQALSGRPVMTSTWEGVGNPGIDHIELAKWADVACVAPCSANTLAKLACGIADDALSTVWMALRRGTVCVLAPAMNTEMWMNPVVQRNRRWLEELGHYNFVEPIEKRLACGDIGIGALADTTSILDAINAVGNLG